MATWEACNAWTLGELTRLNRAILDGAAEPAALRASLSENVLDHLPEPEAFSPRDAQRMLVLLGLAGASIARHHQEADPDRTHHPDESFAGLNAGPNHTAFLDYFTRLAQSTGTGHAPRDSYASLVRWNAPDTLVEFDDRTLARLPGAFPDPHIRTYTPDPGEASFFTLLKHSEALELGVNQALEPVSDGSLPVLSAPAAQRALDATRLMAALIRVNKAFAATDPEHGGLRTEHFMDVFRQFAVHWRLGDVPPTGAQDPEFLRRDFLLGLDFPDYDKHVHRVFPGLLEHERSALEQDMDRTPLAAQALNAAGLDADGLAALAPGGIRALTTAHPALAAWYLLLAANAKFGGVHLMLTEKYLFKPQRVRDASGAGDRQPVSNRRGTTGMEEPLLVRLARARRDHPLRPIGTIGERGLAALCGTGSIEFPPGRLPTVRYAPHCE